MTASQNMAASSLDEPAAVGILHRDANQWDAVKYSQMFLHQLAQT